MDVLYTSELAVAEGVMQTADLKKPHPIKGGLDFKASSFSFLDTLPKADDAIRARDPDDVSATILDLKFLMAPKRWHEAHPIAEKALDKNKFCAYLYYVMAIGNKSEVEGLRWAKRGLAMWNQRTDSPGKGDYIKRGMLQMAIEHCVTIGTFNPGSRAMQLR